ncbi:translational GTPase TypA [Anaerotignum propionicum]|uniref:Large ribosomal subunit assembly factor BipA n=1 Tax=Anaerotignum propionicum DSM 1682 TaxID=991789 RepID=A0A0X1U871_ANAPI|nr:translational GTPase TypA [Anaerotignum propionicum]AMJ41122.1 GTP-binding protein TypA/BipA [Anaerotignum propionicum DSM 1682]SHE64055.1 GTP-binding protein [[Clostridium] propionicum DSM 1682] [Anaerotignum propionicum DSM 1682]
MEQKIENIRNVAIIAHVDHGKTTLVDQLLRQSGIFRSNQVVQERVMDSGDIERERGITILSKNTAVNFHDTKINIIDTPGHADFGGEVERVLKMVDGVVLVVDAFEGPMPQTKFVLRKALELDHPVVVCVNKVDRPEARPDEVVDEVLELFMELDASEKQLDSPFVFASARGGYASTDSSAREGDMMPLFEAIINHVPGPKGILDAPLQALISTIDYSEYVGRIGIGKIENGTIHVNDEVVVLNMHDEDSLKKLRISKLYLFEGLQRVEVKEASVGNIVAISGIENIMIGDTICSPDKPEALPFVKISEPTLSMNFAVNDSPFAGQDGKFVTSRQVRDRLYKELNTDVSLRVEDTESMDCMRVSGRGELHLSILIETLRREGFEFQVSKPEVLFKEIDGKQCEPMEFVTIDVPEEFVGNVIEKLGSRKGEMTNMYPSKGGYTRLEFNIPARGLIGYRNEFLTDTKGNGILNSIFEGYEPYKGEIPMRSQGSLVAFESGEAITYGLYNAQERGNLFIGAGVKVYEGMIVGRNARVDDMDINVCKKKQLTNTRSSGSDDSLRLTTPIQMSLEQCMEFIGEDELLEVTPINLRMRKKILDNNLRRKQKARSN